MGMVVLAGAIAAVPAFGTPSPAAKRAAAAALEPGSRPNIVLIVSDDQTLQTAPYMPTIAGPDWTDFTDYYVNTSLCCPSRATMLSGQWSHHTHVEINENAPRFDAHNTIATWLHAAGYRTGLFGKYLNEYPWNRGRHYVPPGWDDWVAFFKQAKYFDYDLNVNGKIRHHGHHGKEYSTDLLAERTVRFIEQSSSTDATQPFLAVYTPYGPHLPRTPAPRDRNFDGPFPRPRANVNEQDIREKPDWVQKLGFVDPKRQRRQQRAEVATLQSVDDGVARIESALADTGELDDTVIFYVSDNGFSYGSHRVTGKDCSYEECVHVPLRVRATGLGSQPISGLVTNADLAPTMLDLADASATIPLDGVSMLPLLNDGTEVRRDALLHLGKEKGRFMWGLTDGRYKYMDTRRGAVELYDLKRDPLELVDRSHAPRLRGVRRSMARRLAAQER